MEASKIGPDLMGRLLKEVAASGEGPAWIEAWNALASGGWSEVDAMIDSVFEGDADTAAKVRDRYHEVRASLDPAMRP